MKKILVTGSNGQVGKCIQDIHQKYPQYTFIFSNSQSLDLSSETSIHAYFSTLDKLDYILHCAAYTQVELAETEIEKAFAINEKATGILADYAQKMAAVLIYISTDYVFNGQHFKPIKEEEPTAPLSVYGASKLAGEKAAMTKNSKTLVIRTSWVHSPYGQNFVKTMARLMGEKTSLKIVADQIGTPTYAGDLAAAILAIADYINQKQVSDIWGLYHYSSQGSASWYDFGYYIGQKIQTPCVILPQKTEDYPTKAQRPYYSVLDKTKIQNTFGLFIPHWTEGLAYF